MWRYRCEGAGVKIQVWRYRCGSIQDAVCNSVGIFALEEMQVFPRILQSEIPQKTDRLHRRGAY